MTGAFPRTLIETAERVRRRDRSAIEVLDECLAAISRGNSALNAFVYLDEAGAWAAAACAPFRAEGPAPAQINGRATRDTGVECFPVMASACWNSSISVPAGLTADGLPVGLLITTPRHRDDIALRLARILEEFRPWPLWAPG